MSERCETCRFSYDTKPEIKHGNYICRRFPPINVHAVDPYENDAATGAPKIIARGCPIPVNHDWWCGEWSPNASSMQ